FDSHPPPATKAHPRACSPLRKRRSAVNFSCGRVACATASRRQKKSASKGALFQSRQVRLSGMRRAQFHSELLESSDPALLGLAAPGLQVDHELLGRNPRASPELAQFLTHGHELVEHRVVCASAGDLRLERERNAIVVTMQPTLCQSQLSPLLRVLLAIGLQALKFHATGALQL